MALLNTSLIRRSTLFLTIAMLSVSAIAADFNETQRLANQGYSTAQFDLGMMYDQGEEVRQDYTKAFEWYTKAANQGYANAQFNLGVMYLKGRGVRQDYAKAFEWYTKAANQGVADAQYSLGLMYSYGMGVRENMVVSKEWFGKACDNGSQNGCDNYRLLN